MVSIHGPLGYEPNTLTTAPLRWCLRLQSLGVPRHLVLARRRGHVDMIESILFHGLTCCACQFARVVKGVDLRSTAGNCAWVRTPQLTIFVCISFSLSFFLLSSSVRHLCLSPSPPVSLSYDLKLETLRNMVCAKKLEHLTVADFLRCCISWVKSDMIEELALTLILTLIPTSMFSD